MLISTPIRTDVVPHFRDNQCFPSISKILNFIRKVFLFKKLIFSSKYLVIILVPTFEMLSVINLKLFNKTRLPIIGGYISFMVFRSIPSTVDIKHCGAV